MDPEGRASAVEVKQEEEEVLTGKDGEERWLPMIAKKEEEGEEADSRPPSAFEPSNMDASDETNEDVPDDLRLSELRCATEKDMKAHRAAHGSTRPFACSECPKAYKTKQHLKAHMVVHSGERPFKCPFCEETFKYQSHMIVHRRVHTGEKQSSCPECRKGFVSKQAMDAHMASHSDERPIACPHCEKRFKYACDYYYHRRIHDGTDFRCMHAGCTYSTPQKNLFRAHLLTHSGVRNHKCDLCARSFIEKTALMKHRRAIHEGLRPYKCDKCDYSSLRRGQVQEHIDTIHNNLKPYACDQCDFKASRPHRLKGHIRGRHERKKETVKRAMKTRNASSDAHAVHRVHESGSKRIARRQTNQKSNKKTATPIRVKDEDASDEQAGTSSTLDGRELLGTMDTAVKEEAPDLVQAILEAAKAKDELTDEE